MTPPLPGTRIVPKASCCCSQVSNTGRTKEPMNHCCRVIHTSRSESSPWRIEEKFTPSRSEASEW